MTRRERAIVAPALAIALATTLIGACSSSAPDAEPPVEAATSTRSPDASSLSIVQLGDSIASGEGTLYGYEYDTSTRRWTGGDVDARWPPPYPECHVSPDAYGNHVAAALDADLTTFACTGATFAAGIEAPERDDGRDMRPAQFGNWDTRTDLNPDYDDARPDLVLVTLGADDVRFTSIVESCVKNAYARYWHLAPRRCVADRPGGTIEEDFFEFLPTLEANYRTLAAWIRARGGDDPPKVAFTGYPNPLPPDGHECPDTSYLDGDQVRYLTSLVDRLNEVIQRTVTAIAAEDPNVGFVDLADAYTVDGTSHRWCSDDPWAYGLSIYRILHPSSFASQAPFHPTPEGQARLAALVEPVARELLGRS